MPRFIHAADLHIDSPLKGLAALPGAPVDALRNATRAACENLVDVALEEDVDFLVLAGDVFDGRWPDARTGAWLSSQFRRLRQIDAAVYLLWGNHDVANQESLLRPWPDNVFVFPSQQPHTFLREVDGVALHGQSFGRREVPEDLASSYPYAVDGCFNIGLLHTSLTGDGSHDTYASTSEEVLRSRGYDYWALGHIHQRRTISARPYIAFSGNTQGRHVKETGAKGCLLVDATDANDVTVEFRETDVIRWRHLVLDLGGDDGLDEMFDQLDLQLDDARAEADGRALAVRLSFTGASRVYSSLSSPGARADWEAEVRQRAADGGDVWVEKIVLQPEVAEAAQGAAAGVLDQLLAAFDNAANDDQQLRELAVALAPLVKRSAPVMRPADLDWDDIEQLRDWLREARDLVATQLMGAPS